MVMALAKVCTPDSKVVLFSKTYKALKNNPVNVVLDWMFYECVLPEYGRAIFFPFALTNIRPGNRFVKTRLVNPPDGWYDRLNEHGIVGFGYTIYARHYARRALPPFVEGEYNETVTLAVDLYRDPGYTDLDITLLVDYYIQHYRSDGGYWTVLARHEFSRDNEGWLIAPDLSKSWDYQGSVPIRVESGYPLLWSITSNAPNQTNSSLQVWSASFDQISEPMRDTVEQLVLDTKGVPFTYPWIDPEVQVGWGLHVPWLCFSGKITRLNKSRFGFLVLVNRPAGEYVFYKQGGYTMPSNVSKLRFSGRCVYYPPTSRWYLDLFSIVYK